MSYWRSSTLIMPPDLTPALCDLTIVCGAPASGKSTFARAFPRVIDLDVIVQAVSGYPFRAAPNEFTAPALKCRNDILRELGRKGGEPCAFIVSAPERAERRAWKKMLCPARVVVLNPGERECIRRIQNDETRRNQLVRRRQIWAVRRWYKTFRAAPFDEVIGDGSANPYQSLYNSAAWKRRRARQLTREPLCRYCKERGIINDGGRDASGDFQKDERRCFLVADHIEPHNGDPEKFFHGELQTLCPDHHDGAKKGEEIRGYSNRIGADGWPSDPNHPGNQKFSTRASIAEQSVIIHQAPKYLV